jgi:ATP-binding cassette subfamily F protein 1
LQLHGPTNGMGKTTIMKLLARRKLPVPDFIDILLVEQEVVGDHRTALESVVAADVAGPASGIARVLHIKR